MEVKVILVLFIVFANIFFTYCCILLFVSNNGQAFYNNKKLEIKPASLSEWAFPILVD